MITPVTPKLAAELAATESLLAKLDKVADQARGLGVNDRDHYVRTVDTLEALAVATLAATSSVPLTAMATQPGARFDIGAGSSLAHQVTESVAYLRETASELLARGGFSPYKRDATNVALTHLKGLYSLLLTGIITQAEDDLAVVKAKGVNDLLISADTLAKMAAAKAPEGDPFTEPVGQPTEAQRALRLKAKLEARDAATDYQPTEPVGLVAKLEAREAGTWNPAG